MNIEYKYEVFLFDISHTQIMTINAFKFNMTLKLQVSIMCDSVYGP